MVFATLVVSVGATELPESAIVAVPEALIRSGPGVEFYATGLLTSGAQVEVYRHKDDGWCAIRPPQDSFSYVRADHVRPTDVVDVLQVTQAGTKTRVGSSLRSAFQVEYVALKAGERVQQLGNPVRLAKSRHAWYRIAPPAGEFRWIRARDLRFAGGAAEADQEIANRELALPTASSPAPSPPLSDTPSNVAPSTSPPSRQVAEIALRESKAAPATDGISFEKLTASRGQMSTEPIQISSNREDQPITLASYVEPADDSGDRSPIADASPQEPTAWTAVGATPISTRSPPAVTSVEHVVPTSPQADPDLRLSELELSLSRMVTQEVDRWNLAPLRQQVQEVMTYLPDQSGQRSGRQLLERIDEFARLQRRHYELATPSAAERAREISLSTALTPRIPSRGLMPPMANVPPDPPNHFLARQAAIRRQAEDPHFAGEGYLVPVIASQPNLPQFALTDSQGSILAFVSPRPGLNLRRYQRREVGIVGRETARTDEQAPHILADRVVVLDRRRR